MRTQLWLSALGLLLVSASAIAESMDCSRLQKSTRFISNQTIEPGDRPDRRMTQSVRVDVLSSKNAEWDGAEQILYGHSDSVSGAGTHMGYSVTTLKSGDKVWIKYEGVHHISKRGEAWEMPNEGVFRFIAGTGKYKAIRGGGYYRGMSTPEGVTTDVVCQAEY